LARVWQSFSAHLVRKEFFVKWLENIRLRTTFRHEAAARQQLLAMVGEIQGESGLMGAKLFVNALQSGDLALNLYWDTPQVPTQGSRLGLSLLATLKDFGMLRHSLWTEQTSRAQTGS
jgi:hypothetical protein